MAFDAAAPTVQAPPPGANASTRSAARQGEASDPFGALLAMLDGAQSDRAPDSPTAPTTGRPSEKSTKADDPIVTEDAKETAAADPEAPAPADVAVTDPALLVAAMMTSPAVTPTPIAAPPAADAEASPSPQAGQTPQTAQPLPTAEAEIAASAPAPVIEAASPTDAPVAPQALSNAALAELPTAALMPQPAQAAPTPPRLASSDKPAEPATVEGRAADFGDAAPKLEGANQGRGEHLGGDPDGQPSDAEVSQQAQIDRPATPAADAAPAAVATAAPEAPAPSVGASQPAVAAPVIAAQAAAVPVRGAPETVAHLAAQMIQRLDGQTTRFDLTLNPQSLGRVDVRIEIGAKGALRARMAFDDAATAQEMSGRHTELRAALQSAGFDVPEGALSFDVASGGGGAFAERQDADRAATPIFQNLADTADQSPAALVKNYFSAAGSSGVDIRV